MNIIVPATDLEKIGTTSIPIPGQSGNYIAGLSVYHELHCLKRIQRYIWLDHYFPNQTAEEARLQKLHTDHCIEILRQAILCHGDTSLFTVRWSEGSRIPRADFSNEHTCVDWDALNSWAGERSVPQETMRSLKHPFLGAAFPDGHSFKLGAVEDNSKTIDP
ncbi:hypothetical protein EG328_012031 [Venturia inaequalis]|uniref:Tat pathway signal sequence protein n=1 Tax=Venturia inaequalis TaxID=5025 RepID=A0A8H3Z2H2_VENIN|nr:hypothetical protein EG328_012031 [Venturia inaequalis]